MKGLLASTFETSGLNGALLWAQQRWRHPYARAVNYHDVPPEMAPAFEEQLRFFSAHFVSAGLEELVVLQSGRWKEEKPGLILSFDDGLRSHADVVAPILEKYGFNGWFMVPVGFVDAPEAEQRRYAGVHHIHCDAYAGQERIALSWEDLKRLDKNHVVGCHTYHHRRLTDTLSDEELDDEIPRAKARLEQGLGRSVSVFAWVGGEEWSYSARAARKIRDSGFTVSFMTNNAPIRAGCNLLQLQRTNLEAHFPPPLFRLGLSGFFDAYYTPRRRRVNRLTA